MAYIAENRVGQADTLPDWLQGQARLRGGAVALRHKCLGIWREQGWQALAADVAGLAQALAGRGMRAGDSIAILSPPHPEALRLALAAQWLGAVAVPLDPLLPAGERAALLAAAAPDHLYAADAALAAWAGRVAAVDGLLLQGPARGIETAPAGGFVALDTLRARSDAAHPPIAATPQRPAFAFYRIGAAGQVERRHYSHVELLREGRAVIATERLSFRERALAARAFAAAGQARYLLAPWLLAGFSLNFPETLATRDADRRELGPTLVLGTRDTYGRLHRQLLERLPPPGRLTRRLVDAALHAPHQAGPLGRWLRYRLREVLGFSRTRVPLLVGEPLADDSAKLFLALGVRIRRWPDAADWREAGADTQAAPDWLNPAPQAI